MHSEDLNCTYLILNNSNFFYSVMKHTVHTYSDTHFYFTIFSFSTCTPCLSIYMYTLKLWSNANT